MMNPNQSILQFKKKVVLDNSVGANTINGDDSERFAASILLIALGCELKWGSRNEDGRKIDLLLSYDHPWLYKERMIMLGQVKSGPTYGASNKNGFTLLGAAKVSVKTIVSPMIMFWVDRVKNQLFWAFLHTHSTLKPQHYSSIHSVTPAIRFDLARVQSMLQMTKKGGKGIILKKKSSLLINNRKLAKECYKQYKMKPLFSPCFGEIEFSNKSWRQLFRKSRSAKNKEASLITIPYLDLILSDLPSKIYVTSHKYEHHNKSTHRLVEYVLHYSQVELYDPITQSNKKTNVICRVIEEIVFPSHWKSIVQISQLVFRRVNLLSCYYK